MNGGLDMINTHLFSQALTIKIDGYIYILLRKLLQLLVIEHIYI